MAKNAAATAYQPIKLDQLPRRNAGPRVDIDAANALLAIVNADPETGATDGVVYETSEAARTAGLRASRLLAHVAPKGKRPTIRTGEVGEGDNKGWAFAVSLRDAKPSK